MSTNWKLEDRRDMYLGTVQLNREQIASIVDVYQGIEKMRKRWGTSNECIDDPEEMWMDIPECLEEWAPALGKAIGLLPPEGQNGSES